MGVNYEKLQEHLKDYTIGMDPIPAIRRFVLGYLDPKPENYMDYRYEHMLRVALWGKRIAEGEGWDPEPLIIGGLLHDVSYPDCQEEGSSDDHPAASAIIARELLTKIGYDPAWIDPICTAIQYHDRWNDLPEGLTAFELSVRDSDDLDRFDMMRNSISLSKDMGEFRAGEILAACDKTLAVIDEYEDRICGTETAKRLWKEKLAVRREMYLRSVAQANNTYEMDAYIASLE